MKKRENNYDYLVKLLIIGNSGVGKTNLLMRFCEDSFLTSHLSTIGIDFKTKTVFMGGARVKMQIWDTAGQQRFKTITQTYYRGAIGIILTYSVQDRTSFTDIQNWIKQIRMHASPDVIKILVGNKCDASKRQVSQQEGSKLAQQLNIPFFQTSAKDNINVTDMFMEIGMKSKKLLQQQKPSNKVDLNTTRNFLNQNNQSFKKGKKKCC